MKKRKINSSKRQDLLSLEDQLTQKLQQGLMHHQNGLIQEAKVIYAEILNRQPTHFHAIHLLGLIASKEKNYQLAVDLITKAIIIYPDNPAFHSNLGLALKELKKFDAAIGSFKKAISIQPNFAEAYANYGNVLQILKHFDAAIASYDKAISIQPDFASFYFVRGNILHEMNLYSAAIASYDKAISIQPDYAIAYVKCGNVLHGLKQYETAIVYYDKAITVQPDLIESHFSRGNALCELKQYEAAIVCYDKVISTQPDFAEAYSNRGNAFYELKQYETAIVCYDNAISLRPNYAEAYFNRGNVLKELKQYEAAIVCYDNAISLRPNYAEAYFNRGNSLHGLKQYEATMVDYDRAISIRPNYAELYFNRGNVLYELKQYEAAIFCYDKAISIRPDYFDAYCNRSNVLKDLKEYETAITGYKKVICLKPNFPIAYYNLGTIQGELHQFEAAIASFDQAIELKPDYAEAHWNLALLHLLLGNFKDGWQEYEWRWYIVDYNETIRARFSMQALWLGIESLQNKTILLYAEQGLGDVIHFSRYVPLVAALGAKVILEAPSSLVKLLKDLDGVSQIIAYGDELPEFDYQCPLLSLPLAFKTNLKNIPSSTSYLKSNNNKVNNWKIRLGKKIKTRIGLVWSSTSSFPNDSKRSMTLAELLPALPNDQFEYICLQKEIKPIDQVVLNNNPQIRFFGSELLDFTDTGALIECVDLIVSTCTSLPHLAGALDKKVILMISHSPDWRWMLNRNDSPWYRSISLLRQPSNGDWDTVIENLKTILLALK